MKGHPIFLEYQQRVNHHLEAWLPDIADPFNNKLKSALHYAVFNGGKRLRPIFVYTVGHLLGAKLEQLDAAAAAIELIHSYSLVHDDLPAMDDDDLRRGQPSCHKQFDEATAILVGDALQTLAFQILSDKQKNCVSETQIIEMIQSLAKASGGEGMVLGQILDMGFEGHLPHLENLKALHNFKTGALFLCCINLAIIAASPDQATATALRTFAQKVGLAFQVWDDIIDETSSTEELGKPKGSDLAREKATFPALMGLDKAKQFATTLYQDAIEAIQSLNNSSTLIALSDLAVHRTT